MTDKVIDLESRRASLTERKKEVRVEALRQAFRAARGEEDPNSRASKRRRKKKK